MRKRSEAAERVEIGLKISPTAERVGHRVGGAR
jgi:hypothetical protein